MAKLGNKNIYVTIDDYGFLPELDSELLTLIDSQQIDRISIVINTRFFTKKEITRLLSLKNLKKDLHLNSTVYENDQFPLAPHRVLWRRILFGLKLKTSLKFRQSIIVDWQKQVDEFRKIFGTNPDALNSHEHVHFHPFLWPLLVSLAERNNIKTIRNGKILTLGKKWPARLLVFWQRKNINHPSETISVSDYLYSYDWDSYDAKTLRGKIFEETELIIHLQNKKDYRFVNGDLKTYC